jgi:shikimate kinase
VIRRVVLVGLPGAGKSSVGAMVADRLGWRFVDLDREIERASGASVAEIFARKGEAHFRQLEREATLAIAGSDRVVVAPGGGWSLDRSNPAALGPGSLVVYLRVSPEVAMARMAGSAGVRPLLAGPEPLRRLEELLAVRESAYMQANHTLSVDSLDADQVAESIVALATGSRPD